MTEEIIDKKPYIHEDEYYYRIVRHNIKKFRLARNWTQQKLADMADLSREYVCDIENESRNKHLTIAVLGRIADAMEIHIVNFFVTEENNDRKVVDYCESREDRQINC